MIRVAVVDDQALFRAGARVIVESQPGMTVVGEAADGRAALDLVARETPDVLLLDMRMPVMDGLETTRTLFAGATPPSTKIILLTTFALDFDAAAAIRAGASGFLLKDSAPSLIIAAVEAVHSGSSVLAAAELSELFSPPPDQAPEKPPEAYESLSTRERVVFRLVARGLSNVEIAAEEFVSESTVKTQVSSVLTKLALRDRIQIVVFAHENGLVRAPADEA